MNLDNSSSRWPRTVRALVSTLVVLGLSSTLADAAAPPVGPLAASLIAQSEYGTIKGRLIWGGSEVPKPMVLQEKGAATKDPSVCAKNMSIFARDLEVDPASKGIRYAFAYLQKPNGKNDEAAKALVSKEPTVVIDQKNCEFLPYATALLMDQKLVLKSSDPVNHNVRYSAFTNSAFNQILPPNGSVEVTLVAERRPIPLFCDIHPWMKGFIMVFDHPFFAVTDKDGSFEIKGVPAGMQNLVVWQEKVGYVTPGLMKGMPVTVKAGQTTDVGEIKLDPAKVKP
jgi:hypothetical protein